MAIILEFRAAAQSLRASGGRDRETPCERHEPADAPRGEIVIFPGVRIERRNPGPAPRPIRSASRGRAQRRKK
jgi:hypothetical protein